jgi:hypothetical protein
MGFSADEMTAHGFRAMASTLMNESGKRSAVQETGLVFLSRPSVPLRGPYAAATEVE